MFEHTTKPWAQMMDLDLSCNTAFCIEYSSVNYMLGFTSLFFFLTWCTDGLVLSHLPDGPTAHFRMSSVRLRKEIKVRLKKNLKTGLSVC